MGAHISQEAMCQVAACVPTGRKHAVSLAALSRASGFGQRVVRQAVQMLNESGSMIVIREPRAGYYIPETAAEIDSYINYNRSYMQNLSRKVRGMKRYRKEAFGDEQYTPAEDSD